MTNTLYVPQEVSKGSAHITSKIDEKFDKTNFMIKNMQDNLAYKYYLLSNNLEDHSLSILEDFKFRYSEYRRKWKSQPHSAFEILNKDEDYEKLLSQINPLCIDIETASICDLACPHCYREYLMTPDKIMDENLYKKIIDEIADLGIPSIKLNWRGEPLLNPKIYDYIKYAKEKGVLEVSINTNATQLNEENSNKLLISGIDHVIFSFDGGTKSTYEKMRPGRFKSNKFENTYNNIKKFCSKKKERGLSFPITKIQMVLTENSRNEVDEFYKLFKNLVDDVTVTHYQERGGKVDDLKKEQKDKLKNYINVNSLDENIPYMVTPEGTIFVSRSRKPCEQLFQRLMITYSGKVGMCCHDWGAKHPVGYVDKKGFKEINDINNVKEKIKKNSKGFELLQFAKEPENFNILKPEVKKLIDIWRNDELKRVRLMHKRQELSNLKICKNCSFKETYNWESIE